MLQCTHTFCKKCISQIIDNKKIRCPFCRKIHDYEIMRQFTNDPNDSVCAKIDILKKMFVQY